MRYPPPDNFEKIAYLRQHFVRFEDSFLGNKEGKNEGSNDNNSGTMWLDMSPIFTMFTSVSF